MTIAELKEKNITEWTKIARTLDPRRQWHAQADLTSRFSRLKAKRRPILPRASLEILPDGYGFLRAGLQPPSRPG